MDSLYVMIKDELLSLIENRTYREGETIPSEEQLAETYGVSRPTARRAVQLLVDAGYLERRPRHGTVVRSPKIDQEYAMTLRSFEEEMHQHNKVPRTQVILNRRLRATSEVAARLEIAAGDEVFKLVRLRYADDIPNVLVDSYMPCDLFPGIAGVDFASTSLYAYFEEQGSPVLTARRRLEVVKADASLSALLDVPQGDPLFRFFTTARTASGRVAEHSVATYRGESNAFEFSTGVICADGSVSE